MFEVAVKTKKGTHVSRVTCSENECSIGKSKDNLVVLSGWKIGKTHAKLELNSDGLYIADNGSKVGTLVNNINIDKFGPLSNEDLISLGDYCITVKTLAKKQACLDSLSQEDALISNNARVELAELNTKNGATNELLLKRKHLEKWRGIVHSKLFEIMDLRRVNVNEMSDDALWGFTRQAIDEILSKMDDFPDSLDKVEMGKQVIAEAIGLGPLEDLIARDDVSEIMVNARDEIYYEVNGQVRLSEITFTNDRAIIGAIERIVAPLGRRIDESSPMVDGRLKDGSRVNAVIPPLALKGPCISIRKFMKERLEWHHLIKFGSITADMAKFMDIAVVHKRNIVISGGTGSGKTTLLNVLSNNIPDDERIITVEDAAELKLYQPNLVGLESRPPNQEGKGEVGIRELVKNCLRMRPDRIVVGECRGGEALDMLQAMNTGHDGSLTTIHSNSPRDCISRLEILVLMSGMNLPVLAIREQISSAVNIIIQQTRFSCGSRRVTSIAEVTGVEAGVVQLGEIFKFQQQGYDDKGKTQGTFIATGLIPEFYEDLSRRGVDVDLSIFNKGRVL
tara:strand:- start:54575 stop:56266 length:1692 start_codon:yes stop_codon:yes gene_type:complete